MPETATAETLVAPARAVPAAGVTNAAILGLGTALPGGRVSSGAIAAELGIEEEWILARTGIRERPRAAANERLSDLAAAAGAAALQRAGVSAAALDFVIVATLTPDEVTPNAAPLVAHRLGAVRAGAFDVGAACTAFLTGLVVAAGQIESGRARRVLLIGADFVSRITDHRDRRTAPLFADGAGAVVLGPAGPGAGRIGPIALGSDGSHGATIIATHAERLLRIDGPEVFRHAVNRMAEATHDAVSLAATTLDEIDLFVYHQANARITRALGERLAISPARIVDCIEHLGNSSAATLPLALAAAGGDGRLRDGSRVLLGAFGAGFTWGAGVITWGSANG